MTMTSQVSVVLHEDEASATISLGHLSTPIIAPVLAVERNLSGDVEALYLRSKISTSEYQYTGWNIDGVISSILTPIRVEGAPS